ncbi:hypothetical protein B0J11DRAFT_342526 [Dendryphion nanum]|uniref:Transmembrane protein n=1 Tax=Dendryphion nanum TaxID=256645 RepID=A0A9P9DQ31_9PLEO|nr:hypothetical protein B0J11DRAFT_342526 [Dendryphion nanum]
MQTSIWTIWSATSSFGMWARASSNRRTASNLQVLPSSTNTTSTRRSPETQWSPQPPPKSHSHDNIKFLSSIITAAMSFCIAGLRFLSCDYWVRDFDGDDDLPP